MTLRFPWRIERLPGAIPTSAGSVFLISAVLKLNKPGYLCFDPWVPANTAMIPLEFVLAFLLWKKDRREFGALLGCATMAGATAVLAWAHAAGLDVRACGCFGAIRMPYGIHLAVNGVLFVLCFATLISSGDDRRPEESVPGGAGSSNLRRDRPLHLEMIRWRGQARRSDLDRNSGRGMRLGGKSLS